MSAVPSPVSAAAPVSAAPVSAAPVSAAPVSAAPVSAAPPSSTTKQPVTTDNQYDQKHISHRLGGNRCDIRCFGPESVNWYTSLNPAQKADFKSRLINNPQYLAHMQFLDDYFAKRDALIDKRTAAIDAYNKRVSDLGATLSSHLKELLAKDPKFFEKNTMSYLENQLAGIPLDLAVNLMCDLVFNILLSNLDKIPNPSSWPLMPEVLKVTSYIKPNPLNPYPNPHALDRIVKSGSENETIKKELPDKNIWKPAYIVPCPFPPEFKFLQPNVIYCGPATKKGSGLVAMEIPYHFFTYTIIIPRANGSTVSLPMIMALGEKGQRKLFLVCKPPTPIVKASKGYTTFPNCFEFDINPWNQDYYYSLFLVSAPAMEISNTIRNHSTPKNFTLSTLLVKDTGKWTTLDQLISFANTSTFNTSSLKPSQAQDPKTKKIIPNVFVLADSLVKQNGTTARTPFTSASRELLHKIGIRDMQRSIDTNININSPDSNNIFNQVSSPDLTEFGSAVRTADNNARKVRADYYYDGGKTCALDYCYVGNPSWPPGPTAIDTDTILQSFISYVEEFKTTSEYKQIITAAAPVSAAPVSAASVKSNGGTNRRSRTKHKRRSNKKRSYKKRSQR